MLLWGHSYDFDKRNAWQAFEEFCGLMQSAAKDVWSATCLDYVDYITAARSVRCSLDGHCMENPSATPVWVFADGKSRCIEPGETVLLGG
jgi:hypothetical protein